MLLGLLRGKLNVLDLVEVLANSKQFFKDGMLLRIDRV